MNLHQVSKLRDGDSITFQHPLFKFTVGKEYPVQRHEGQGAWVQTDNGVWVPLIYEINLQTYFEKVTGRAIDGSER